MDRNSTVLDFPLPTPLLLLVLRSVVQGLHQNPAQAIAAFQVGIDDLESHFIDPRPAQQHMRLDFRPHAHRNLQIGLAADAQIVFLGAHAPAQAQLANQNL